MKKIEEIKNKLEQLKQILREKFEVKNIGVFGSYIKNKEKKESDLDILVTFKPDVKMGLIKFIELERYLSELLGIKVDLVMKSVLKPRIGKHILKEVINI